MCLPTTIQCLGGLEILKIHGCPELGNRCKKETGEDWPKIAHVKDICISDWDASNSGMGLGLAGLFLILVIHTILLCLFRISL
jgi:hypothetical protein